MLNVDSMHFQIINFVMRLAKTVKCEEARHLHLYTCDDPTKLNMFTNH